jgi:hypothetical protein
MNKTKTEQILKSFNIKFQKKGDLLIRVDLGIIRDGKKVDSGRFYISPDGKIHSHGREGWDKEIEGQSIISFLKSSYRNETDESISSKTGLPITQIKSGVLLTEKEKKQMEQNKMIEKFGFNFEKQLYEDALKEYNKHNEKNQTFFKKRGLSNKLLKEFEDEIYQIDPKKLILEIKVLLKNKEYMNKLRIKTKSDHKPQTISDFKYALSETKIKSYDKVIKVTNGKKDYYPTYLLRTKDGENKNQKYTQVGKQKVREINTDSSTLIVCEGQMDYYTMMDVVINDKSVFSTKPSFYVSFNASATAIKKEKVKDLIKGKKNIIFVTDNDSAGKGLKNDFISAINDTNEEILFYDLMNSSNFNDINDMLSKNGIKYVSEQIKKMKLNPEKKTSFEKMPKNTPFDYEIGVFNPETINNKTKEEITVKTINGDILKIKDKNIIEKIGLNLINYDFQLMYETKEKEEKGCFVKDTTETHFKTYLRDHFNKYCKTNKIKEGTNEYKDLEKRVGQEFKIIKGKNEKSKKNYFDYFMNASLIEREFRNNGIVTDKRGTASAFLINSILDIVHKNGYEIIRDLYDKEIKKERFLSLDRNGDPDIDFEVPTGNDMDLLIEKITKKFGMKRGLTATKTPNGLRYNPHVSKYHYTEDTRGGVVNQISQEMETEEGGYQNLDIIRYPSVLNKMNILYNKSGSEIDKFLSDFKNEKECIQISILEIMEKDIPHLTRGAKEIIKKLKENEKQLWVESLWVTEENGKKVNYMRSKNNKDKKWYSPMNGKTIKENDKLVSGLKIQNKKILEVIGIMEPHLDFNINSSLSLSDIRTLKHMFLTEEELNYAVGLNRPLGYIRRFKDKKTNEGFSIIEETEKTYVLESITGNKVEIDKLKINSLKGWEKKEINSIGDSNSNLVFDTPIDSVSKGEKEIVTQEGVMDIVFSILEKNNSTNIEKKVDKVRKFISKSETKINDELKEDIKELRNEIDNYINNSKELSYAENEYKMKIRTLLINTPFLNNRPHNIHLIDQIKTTILYNRKMGVGNVANDQSKKKPISIKNS